MSMTDDASLARPFLDTIRAAMARDDQDAGPWLVYADWLEERGECELAELIRTACELEDVERLTPLVPCEGISSARPMSESRDGPLTIYGATVTKAIADKLKLRIGAAVRLRHRSIEIEHGIIFHGVLTNIREDATTPTPLVILRASWATDPLAARRETLAQRVGELEQAIAKTMPYLGGTPPALTWRRGLIIELSAEWRAWLAHGDAITRRHPVVAVQFSASAIGSASGEFLAAELKGRWPGVAFSWRHATADDFRRITGDRLYEAMREQPVRPGDTLYWLPMQGEERGGEGGPTG